MENIRLKVLAGFMTAESAGHLSNTIRPSFRMEASDSLWSYGLDWGH